MERYYINRQRTLHFVHLSTALHLHLPTMTQFLTKHSDPRVVTQSPVTLTSLITWVIMNFPLSFPAPGCFALTNNMSIDVYGVDDDIEVIYPLGVSCQIDMWIFYCSNVMVYSTKPPLGTLAYWLGDS